MDVYCPMCETRCPEEAGKCRRCGHPLDGRLLRERELRESGYQWWGPQEWKKVLTHRKVLRLVAGVLLIPGCGFVAVGYDRMERFDYGIVEFRDGSPRTPGVTWGMWIKKCGGENCRNLGQFVIDMAALGLEPGRGIPGSVIDEARGELARLIIFGWCWVALGALALWASLAKRPLRVLRR